MAIQNLSLVLIIAAGPALAADCESLTSLKLPGATVSAAQTVASGAFTPPSGTAAPYKNVPAFCRVQGVIQPSTDSQIQFDVWMPAAGWNGKYLGVGNGGFAGSIGYSAMAAAVQNGYAVSSTDTGHTGAATDGEWALGHREKILDFGYRAIHETAEKSKKIVQAFYGGNPKHSYFSSCSNGGRQALLEAQRYPADYDGIIAGAPANFLTHHLTGFVWNAQALYSNPAAHIPMTKMKTIESAALAACDALDGVEDGVIDDPTKCHFDPSTLLCKGADSDQCLTEAQVTALKKLYEGPRNSKGEQIFPGYLPGGEAGLGGWALWITGSAPEKSLQFAFAKGFFANMVFQNAAWDYHNFTFDRDVKIADDTVARTFNATDPNLKAFKDRGGKLLIYHGWSDAAIAPVNTVNYYKSVVAKMGAKQAGDFVELYMVPGMQHCGGGPGPNSFGAVVSTPSDPQHSMSLALERWVEEGVAPDQIIATKYKNDLNPAAGAARTRPLCPYPQVAHYKGTGSTDDAANFTCVAEKNGMLAP
jgi:feruloyl esterase